MIDCIATCFGYEDSGDNGEGAFGDHNDNTSTVGVSLPIPILHLSIGYGSGLIHAHTVTVQIGSQRHSGIRITDEGPGEKGRLIWGRNTGKGHLLDMTYALCQLLGVRYNPNSASYAAQFSIQDQNGHDIEVKGLDWPRIYVND